MRSNNYFSLLSSSETIEPSVFEYIAKCSSVKFGTKTTPLPKHE